MSFSEARTLKPNPAFEQTRRPVARFAVANWAPVLRVSQPDRWAHPGEVVTRLALATALLVWSSAGFAAKPSSLEFAVAAALGASAQFTSARVDLDQDSRPDAVVLVRDAQWCGSGGCVMLVFKGTPKGFALVSRSTITAPPIRVLPSSHHGWRDLIVRSHGTGDVVLRFDGASYPSNPSLQPAPTPQQLRSAVDILGSSPANSPEAPPGGAPQLDG